MKIISALIHFCSVADKIVRGLIFSFYSNPNLEGLEAIFRMAQPLAHGGGAK